ncbi:MAG: hypothetical protein AAF519_09695 [Bacteroidota bacterium]
MIVDTKDQIEELTFGGYTIRQQYEVTLDGLKTRAAGVRPSDKFNYNEGVWEKASYPGYAVVSMVQNNPGNSSLLSILKDIQRGLREALEAPDKCYLLPSESFHQTVANTLSADRFEKHVMKVGMEPEYPEIISAAFDQIDLNNEDEPIKMSMIGLSIFRSAIGILGTFQKALDFQRIIDFRNAFYSNQDLNKLDIRRTRPFIGHITLAYLDGNLTTDFRNLLTGVCQEINQGLSSESLLFNISNTELRKYDDLSHFQTLPHFPKYSFVNQ